jgi:porin
MNVAVDEGWRRAALMKRAAASLLSIAVVLGTAVAQESKKSSSNLESGAVYSGVESDPALEWFERDQLTGNWGGARSWLLERGFTVKPRLTQFYQGMPQGAGDSNWEYGGKTDLLINVDLDHLGLWEGLSLTVHGEHNFGQSVNGRGGTVVPVNTALFFPGIDGAESFDLSSVYLAQEFGDSVSLAFGKINMIDIAANKPFMGGAGIGSFWNTTFTAPPSGTVPPYLLGALLSLRTKSATFGLWIYDPISVVNQSGLEDPFGKGLTIRGSVDFPITIADLPGHQGFVATYSTLNGVDLDNMGDLLLPPFPPGDPAVKTSRYYFAYLFDQYLYRSKENPDEGFGVFGQFGISDGNPNGLYWSALAGFGGTGLIPHRSEDNWGLGVYFDTWSPALRQSLEPKLILQNEFGIEAFYNFSVMPAVTIGADLQLIRPTLADQMAVFAGLRTVVDF